MDEWRKLFPVDNFTEKVPRTRTFILNILFFIQYHHFVVISCVVSARVHIDQFCGFAERKVRLQLQQIDQSMEHIVEYSHVKPDPNLAKNNECPKRFYNETFRCFDRFILWLIPKIRVEISGIHSAKFGLLVLN